jgi:hypothetical protein
MLVSVTLIHPEVISFSAEVEIHEEKVFAHLDEEKERDVGTWVLDTGATGLSCLCARTMSSGPSTGFTSSLV